MAWFHTTTSGTTWERFVAGRAAGAARSSRGCSVDDSAAFPDQTTAVAGGGAVDGRPAGQAPHPVVQADQRRDRRRSGCRRWPRATRPRWRSSAAGRATGPSTSPGRWPPRRPGTATGRCCSSPPRPPTRSPTDGGRRRPGRAAEPDRRVPTAGRSGSASPTGRWPRRCSTSSGRPPGLRPQPFAGAGPGGRRLRAGGLRRRRVARRPSRRSVFTVAWQDDPYSTRPARAVHGRAVAQARPQRPTRAARDGRGSRRTWSVPFSVGGFYPAEPVRGRGGRLDPGASSAAAAAAVAAGRCRPSPPRPGGCSRTLAEAAPRLGQPAGRGHRRRHLGEHHLPRRRVRLAGPAAAGPAGPVHPQQPGRRGTSRGGPTPAGRATNCRPPTSTEDVLHFAELARRARRGGVPAADVRRRSRRDGRPGRRPRRPAPRPRARRSSTRPATGSAAPASTSSSLRPHVEPGPAAGAGTRRWRSGAAPTTAGGSTSGRSRSTSGGPGGRARTGGRADDRG